MARQPVSSGQSGIEGGGSTALVSAIVILLMFYFPAIFAPEVQGAWTLILSFVLGTIMPWAMSRHRDATSGRADDPEMLRSQMERPTRAEGDE